MQNDSVSKNVDGFFNGLTIVQAKSKALNQQYQLVKEKELASYHYYYLARRYLKFGNVNSFKLFIKKSLKEQVTLKNIIYYVLSMLNEKGGLMWIQTEII